MLPLCADQGVASIPWSPLARGRLTRPWDEQTARSEIDEFGRALYNDGDRPIVDALIALAAQRAIAPAQIALAWLLSKGPVTSPIVGATKPHHLEDAVAALTIKLDDAEVAALETPYRAHAVLGFR